MQRYELVLKKGLEKRGHQVRVWGPKLFFSGNVKSNSLKKWLRYIDQYFLFPIWFKFKSSRLAKDTLFVLIDQALGIWAPMIKNKKHIIHCHDFIALKSSLGLIEENPTSKSGKVYQKLILNGFSKADNFISISKNTQKELIDFLPNMPAVNAQVYNAIDTKFKPKDPKIVRAKLAKVLKADFSEGYVLHVGGSTFYKNREGVLRIYEAWRHTTELKLPLMMIGSPPTELMLALKKNSDYSEDIYFLTRVTDEVLLKAYQGASVFIFPSLLEGFGFPIAEAMACGCLVITTNEAPMNEVGGAAAFYIDRYYAKDSLQLWSQKAAEVVEKVLQLSEYDKQEAIAKGIAHCEEFSEDRVVDQIEKIYQKL